MNIDYDHLQNHIEIIIFKDKRFVCDRNHDVQEDPENYKIIQINEDFCNFWARTSNRSLVRTYFKNKYQS